jgi:hypothetical protein
VNPRIIKELKVLLPGLVLAWLGAILTLCLNLKEPEVWTVGLSVFGCLILMGAEAFGSEFQQNTMALLLSQPVSRATLWKEKMTMLGGALTLGAGVFLAAISVSGPAPLTKTDWMAFALVPLGAFCTAPFWTLVFGSALAGGLFTVIVPVVVLGLNDYVYREWLRRPEAEQNTAIALLVLYCGVACWLGYRRFKALQVVEGQMREVGLPAGLEGILLRPWRGVGARFAWPFASLVKKELRVQQFSFLGAGLFCAVAIAATALRQLHLSSDAQGGWTSPLLMVDFFIYLPVLPLVVGAVSVAEEKSWGLADWQLTMPPSVFKQWCAKLLVTFFTSIALGLILPAALALAGGALLAEPQNPGNAPPPLHALRGALNFGLTGGTDLSGSLASVPVAIGFLCCLALGQSVLTSVAIYAATLCAKTARALVLASGLVLVGGALMKIVGKIVFDHREASVQIASAFWSDQPPAPMTVIQMLATAFIVLLCLLLGFSYSGYRRRGLTVRRRATHALVLAVAVCVLTSGLLILGELVRLQ